MLCTSHNEERSSLEYLLKLSNDLPFDCRLTLEDLHLTDFNDMKPKNRHHHTIHSDYIKALHSSHLQTVVYESCVDNFVTILILGMNPFHLSPTLASDPSSHSFHRLYE